MSQTSQGDLWKHIEDVFQAACDLPAAKRREFVEKECVGNATLQREVQSLLDSMERAPNYIETSVLEIIDAQPDEDSEGGVGSQIGAYRLTNRIGAGGMGTVYLAERADGQYTKKVAVKLIKSGIETEDLLRRFRGERQVLAALEHPNIARLIDGGSTRNGRPYLVMEHIAGQPIDQFCDNRKMSIAERLTLFLDVCEAVQHAHRNLVVHRDLKPQNMLVDDSGTVKLLDFGIAKVLGVPAIDASDVTSTMTRLLTPRYASPEQVLGEPITTACDVYSLGVVLYELLTGHRPYLVKTDSQAALERAICENEPTRPSMSILHSRAEGTGDSALSPETICAARRTDPRQLRRQLTGDLDKIVLMSLRKEHQRRYASVELFRADIDRYLRGLPVMAQPATFRYRASKFIKRNEVGVAAAVLLATAIIGWVASSSYLYMQADAARRSESAQRATAEQVSSFLSEILTSIDPETARGRDVTVLQEVLDNASRRVDTELAGQPHVAEALHLTIGRTYRRLGLFDESEDHLSRAVDLARSENLSTERVIHALRELGQLRIETGEYGAGERLHEEALQLAQREWGDRDTRVADIKQGLGELLGERGKYDAARRHLEDALAINKLVLGSEHERVAGTLSNLGLVLLNQGRLDEALKRLNESVRIARTAFPATDPRLATLLHNLGWVQIGLDNYDAAERALREALDIRRLVLPPDHPKIGLTMGNLGVVQLKGGVYEKAAQTLRDVIEFLSRTLGPTHQHVASAMNNLALALMELGDVAGAEAQYVGAARIYREALDPEHPYVAMTLSNHARLLRKGGRFAEALALFEEVLAMRRKGLPADHTDIAWTVYDLATVLQKLGRGQEARAGFDDEIQRRRDLLGMQHPSTAEVLRRLAIYLLDIGDPAAAEPELRAAIRILEDNAPNHGVKIRELRLLRAKCLVALTRYSEAESALLTLWEQSQTEAKDAPTDDIIHQLFGLYEAWDRADEAAEWRAKLKPKGKPEDIG